MYSVRKVNGKNHPGQNLPDKRSLIKPPAQKLPRTIEREFVLEVFVQVFVQGLLKMRCVRYIWGSRGCVTKCDRKRRSKLAKNSDDVLYGRPQYYCFSVRITYFLFFFDSVLTVHVLKTGPCNYYFLILSKYLAKEYHYYYNTINY